MIRLHWVLIGMLCVIILLTTCAWAGTGLTPQQKAAGSGHSLMGGLLSTFTFVLSHGTVRTMDDALWLFTQFATIEFILVALSWHAGHGMPLESMVWKIIGLSVLFWIISDWKYLLDTVRVGFIEAGLLMGDNVVSVTDITDPGNIADFGMSVTAILFKNTSVLLLFTNGFKMFMNGLACWFIEGAYFIISIQIFVALLEFYLVGCCCFFLLPFFAWQKSAFIGERVFATMIQHGVRLLLLSLLVNIMLPVLITFQLPLDPGWEDISILAFGSFIFLVLALSAPLLASGIAHGTPGMSASSIVHAVVTVTETAGVLYAVGGGISMAGGAIIRGSLTTGAALQTAAQVGARHYRGMHHLGSGSRSASMIGGAHGIAMYMRTRTLQGFRDAIATGRARGQRFRP
jgi:type IV secretion system protein TrbL